MSALGQKQTSAPQKVHVRFTPNSGRDSGFPQKVHVRFTPKSRHVRCTSSCPLWANSGHRTVLLDDLVGNSDYAGWNAKPKRFCSFEIDNELKFGRLQNR